MDWTALVQGLLTNWLSDALVVGGGIVLAILKRRDSKWAGTIAYFLAACAFLSILGYTFTGRALLSVETPHTTPQNVELNIRSWADKFSFGVRKQTDNDFSFVYAVTVPSGRMILVGSPKIRPGYLLFRGNLLISPEHQAALKKLSPAQLERISDEINLEMARNKTGFTILNAPFREIVVSKGVPITSNLTEDSFLASLDEIDSSILLAREATRLAFFHNGVPDVMPRPEALR
ncbi:MAG: DUF2299 family protein [Candidatus Acidiferrum sp.]